MTARGLALILAATPEGVIGKAGALPWRLPEDMARFRALTMGHAVIMGRKTFDSIGRPLPGRTNYVVSRSAGLALPGCIVSPSLEAALASAQAADPLPFVIGGAELYRAAEPRATRVYLTEVRLPTDGDTRFVLDRSGWREVERTRAAHDPVDFVVLERV